MRTRGRFDAHHFPMRSCHEKASNHLSNSLCRRRHAGIQSFNNHLLVVRRYAFRSSVRARGEGGRRTGWKSSPSAAASLDAVPKERWMSRFRTLLTYEEDTFIARCRRSAQPLAEGMALRVLPVGKAVGHAPAGNRRRGGRRGKLVVAREDVTPDRPVRLQLAAQAEVSPAGSCKRRHRRLRGARPLEHHEPRLRQEPLRVGARRLAAETIRGPARLRLRQQHAIAEHAHQHARILDELLHRRALPFLHDGLAVGLLGQRPGAVARLHDPHEPMLQIADQRLVQVAPQKADRRVPEVGLLPRLRIADVLEQAIAHVLGLADVDALIAVLAVAAEKEIDAGPLDVRARASRNVIARDFEGLAVPVGQFGHHQSANGSVGEVKFNALAVICHVSVPHAHQFGNSIPFPARPSQHRFIRGLSPGVVFTPETV